MLRQFLRRDPRRLVHRAVVCGGSLLGRTTHDVFSVWRPVSNDALRKMWLGEGVGKGLNIKGKSAKMGRLSGFVPFVQISDAAHVAQVEAPPPTARCCVFYGSAKARTVAAAAFEAVLAESSASAAAANLIKHVDSHAPDAHGLDLPQWLLWEVCVVRSDIRRSAEWATGRASSPELMAMNLEATRERSQPMPVVWQADSLEPMNAAGLVLAYQETRVRPVVSDFDGFLCGTRGIAYFPLPGIAYLPLPDPDPTTRLKTQLSSQRDGQHM